MSEHHFGVGRGKLDDTTYAQVETIAKAHGADFINANVPGNGYIYWFSCPNRGEPFDSATAKAVLADVADQGIQLPGQTS